MLLGACTPKFVYKNTKQLTTTGLDNSLNLLRSMNFARGLDNTQDAIFAAVLLSDEIQMFKVARQTGEITDFRAPITNFEPGMSYLAYMDNKPKTNFWFVCYHTYAQTYYEDPPLPSGIYLENSQGPKGFFKVEITADSVNKVFFKNSIRLY